MRLNPLFSITYGQNERRNFSGIPAEYRWKQRGNKGIKISNFSDPVQNSYHHCVMSIISVHTGAMMLQYSPYQRVQGDKMIRKMHEKNPWASQGQLRDGFTRIRVECQDCKIDYSIPAGGTETVSGIVRHKICGACGSKNIVVSFFAPEWLDAEYIRAREVSK